MQVKSEILIIQTIKLLKSKIKTHLCIAAVAVKYNYLKLKISAFIKHIRLFRKFCKDL